MGDNLTGDCYPSSGEDGPIGKHPTHEEKDVDHGHEGNGRDNGCEGGVENGGFDGGGEGHGHGGGDGHNEGEGGTGRGNDPAHIVAGGLLCFREKHIYNSCDESCRLSAKGDLHVPHDQVDEFCNGPCLEETNHVLDCLEEIMDNFLFFNQATTQNVRDTISAACGHGFHRGDLDVGEHISEADEGSGSIGSEPKFGLLSFTVITILWLIFVQ
ncbi:uncharacterized protein LOC141655114 [Silene latifolia]|uniref:uncharacterized protein LOC141655114 n=1 Tax=Silene latifolia TaxID=37657 RepID=UPI003D775158